jgi:esterase/lipase superfamily enzyme
LGRQKLQFGEGLDWGELRLLSVLRQTSKVPVKAVTSDELVRFPPTPIPLVMQGGRKVPDPVIANSYAKAEDSFRAEMRRALRITPDGEVLVYIHGVNNNFERGAGTIANLWHFTGRTSVPIVYTWPAGTPGLVGYFSDRESSIFSIFHFKQFLTLLAAMPEVKKINMVAHSQGTALTTSGLREMVIAERAAGRDPRKSLKIDTLILAAPDLNYDVFGQRFLAERFNDAFGQVTIYTSSNDYALGIAQFLFRGVRVGRVTYDDLDSIQKRVLQGASNIHIVNVEAVVGRDSHSYFHKNPDVLSDIVITLRTGLPPGGEERPLEFQKGNFWNLHAGYPFDRPRTVFADTKPSP